MHQRVRAIGIQKRHTLSSESEEAVRAIQVLDGEIEWSGSGWNDHLKAFTLPCSELVGALRAGQRVADEAQGNNSMTDLLGHFNALPSAGPERVGQRRKYDVNGTLRTSRPETEQGCLRLRDVLELCMSASVQSRPVHTVVRTCDASGGVATTSNTSGSWG